MFYNKKSGFLQECFTFQKIGFVFTYDFFAYALTNLNFNSFVVADWTSLKISLMSSQAGALKFYFKKNSVQL